MSKKSKKDTTSAPRSSKASKPATEPKADAGKPKAKKTTATKTPAAPIKTVSKAPVAKSKPAARKPAAKKTASKKTAPAKAKEPAITLSTEEISLRAYFIAERRQKMGWPGNSDDDWLEAEAQLRAEARAAAKKRTK